MNIYIEFRVKFIKNIIYDLHIYFKKSQNVFKNVFLFLNLVIYLYYKLYCQPINYNLSTLYKIIHQEYTAVKWVVMG